MRVSWKLLIVAAAVAAGTWIGVRSRSDGKLTSATPNASAMPLPPPPSAGAVEDDSDDWVASADEGIDRPWPRLNEEASLSKAWRIADGPHRKPGEHRKFVTLTFDDGPFPETTPKVLDLLAKRNIHATFFVIGRYLDGDGDRAAASRAVLKKTYDAGHVIGNHTHDHSLLTNIARPQVIDQIDRGASSIERVIGQTPTLIRPPYGQLDEFGQEAVRDRNLDILLWNIEAKDMERDDSATMYKEMVHQLAVKDGGVVLLHDIKWSSIKVLERLLDYLHAKRWDPKRPNRDGYVVVDLPTYLHEIEANPPRERRRAKR